MDRITTEPPICFVISPIGESGSDVRKNADDLYDLLIEPALERFGFRVLRADKLDTVGSITSEIVELIQKSELCIIDITGKNANVMYECGRRHETGKPYLMVARQGEILPFDITTIRTIFYDLESPRSTRDQVRTVQQMVERIVGEGFEASSSGDSLASVAESLRRIERKLERGSSLIPVNASMAGGTESSQAVALIKKYGVVTAFNFALSQRDSSLIDELIPRLSKKSSTDENYFKGGLSQGAALGSQVAFEELLAGFEPIDRFSPEMQRSLIGGLVAGANRLDRELEVLEVLEPIFERVREGTDSEIVTAEDRAFILNQSQKLLNGMGDAEAAFDVGQVVLQLAPRDAAYIYNQSINARELGRMDMCESLTDRVVELTESADDPDGDHLITAIRHYLAMGRAEKAAASFDILRQHHPILATTIEDELVPA